MTAKHTETPGRREWERRRLLGTAASSSNAYTDTVMANHIAAADPHTQYLLESVAATTYLPLAGGTMTGAILGWAGAVGTPGYAFAGDADTGLYSGGADAIAFTCGGLDRARITSTGRFLVGHTSTVNVNGVNNGVQVMASDGRAGISQVRFSANANPPQALFGKSRSATIGTLGTAVVANDTLGRFGFCGDDGTDLATQAAGIDVIVAAAVSTGIVPGEMRLSTMNTAGATLDAVRITSEQRLLTQPGAVGTPTWSYITDPDTGFYRIGANNEGWAAGGVKQAEVSTDGFFASRAFHAPIKTITSADSPYTLTTADWTVLCDTSGGSITVAGPTAAGSATRVYNLKKIDAANTVTFNPNGAELVDGAATLAWTTLNQAYTVQSDGTQWRVL